MFPRFFFLMNIQNYNMYTCVNEKFILKAFLLKY